MIYVKVYEYFGGIIDIIFNSREECYINKIQAFNGLSR